MKTRLTRLKIFAFVVLIFLVNSCQYHADYLTVSQSAIVKDSVQQMVDSIAKAVSYQGPVAWIRYFENSPDFFMASQGQLAFTNNDSLANFLKNTYSKTVSKIDLSWNHVRIDPFTTRLAGIAAIFHEDITDIMGKKSPTDGYFTAVAHQSPQGWRLQNAHWSIIPIK
jgi:hypothetical protein